MKEAGNRILMLGSLGPGACLAWRHAHLAYAVFVFCRLSASSLPPPGVVADMDIRTVLKSDILQPVVGQYTVAKLICNDGCVVLVNKGTAALLR